jgi:hypothetical protein
MPLPRQLSAADLEREAQRSVVLFVEQRLAEGTRPYRAAFDAARAQVSALFRATDNLLAFDPAVFADPAMVDAARYLAGPPVSSDDLRTLARLAPPQDEAEKRERIARVLWKCLDPFRFPWLAEGGNRVPARRERDTAIVWTCSLWAVEKCRTSRRTESSAQQERRVAELFRSCGLLERDSRAPIQVLDELPRLSFVREVPLGGAKADLAVRLADGRLLAIECKVSNSAVNSVKRLNREAAGKAERWRTHYGLQVIPAVVLSGVFNVANLVDAQGAGVFIFWEHALVDLDVFVRAHMMP